jgi:hypothetical protein
MQVYFALTQGRGYVYSRHCALTFAHFGDARDPETAVEFRYHGLCFHIVVLHVRLYGKTVLAIETTA